MSRYVSSKIEKKWQQTWSSAGLYRVDLKDAKKKYYLLVELPYPSGDLHMGHWFTFAVADILGRLKKMQGYNVFFPVGFDAFGLPAENAAIKRGINPREWTYGNIEAMKKQFASMGGMHDFEHGVITCDSDYYRWNQWIFLKMFEKGLAYRGKTLSNWCTKDQTVLANENVENGKCWRCGTEVVQKEIPQWFLKITDYADKLEWKGDEQVDWPKPLTEGQNNWIGKSEGIEINFPLIPPVILSSAYGGSEGSKSTDSSAVPQNDTLDQVNFVLLHGFTGSPNSDFFPWLKKELESRGFEVEVPALPNTDDPDVYEQVEFVLKNTKISENTILLGHSLGSVVALKVLERLKKPIRKTVFAAGFMQQRFKDHKRPFEQKFDWKFDVPKIKQNTGEVVILRAQNDTAVYGERAQGLKNTIGGTIVDFVAQDDHITGKVEPVVLANVLPAVRVFTKFPETIYGVTFMVVAPEHPIVNALLQDGSLSEAKGDFLKPIEDYVAKAKKKSELERMSLDKQKSGVFTGLYCINPVNNYKVPIWVADYVIGGYGTGAVMGVPGSDVRDFDFAKKYDLPVIQVIASKEENRDGSLSLPKSDFSILDSASFTRANVLEQGYIVNSGQFNGIKTPEPAKEKFKDYLEELGWGARKINYHLHDWSMSRQRYWGTPIPIIYCSNCAKHRGDFLTGLPSETLVKVGGQDGSSMETKFETSIIDGKEYAIIPVPEKDLPVEIPDISDYAPHGKPPLATASDWVNVKCPNCGGDAKREVETMDTFVDSSWYFLAYLNDKGTGSIEGMEGTKSTRGTKSTKGTVIASEAKQSNSNKEIASSSPTSRNDDGWVGNDQPWVPEYIQNWMPVDIYIGGAEHTLGHTLYSRFFVKFLHDLGLVPFDEYAKKRVHHGVILGPDGQRMSKSKGNVVNPDEQVSQFGADAVRMYLAFLGPYDLVAPWNPSGINGVYHFLQRVCDLGEKIYADGKADKHGSASIGLTNLRESLSVDDLHWMHKTIKKVGEDIAEQKFNTAVAALMEWLNYLSKKAHSAASQSKGQGHSVRASEQGGTLDRESGVTLAEYKTLLHLLAPFAPHMTEELWQSLKNFKLQISNCKLNPEDSIHSQPWPQYDEKYLKTSKVTIVVQINGKVRDNIEVDASTSQQEIEKLARQSEKIKKFLVSEPKKVIFVPGKLINFVV